MADVIMQRALALYNSPSPEHLLQDRHLRLEVYNKVVSVLRADPNRSYSQELAAFAEYTFSSINSEIDLCGADAMHKAHPRYAATVLLAPHEESLSSRSRRKDV